LFFVFLEIGRKLRFFNVLRRPQSVWMTRETYELAVLYPALLANLICPSAAPAPGPRQRATASPRDPFNPSPLAEKASAA
jgi:hypothetical protein